MEPGTAFYLWFVVVPGFRPFPVGVFDHPHDDSVPGLRSIPVGRSRVVSFLGEVTELVDELSDFLDRIQVGPF